MKLSQTRVIRSSTIDLGDGLSFTFKHRSFTPAEWDYVNQQAQKAEDEWGIVLKLATVVTETGLEFEDGQPIPPTPEGLRQIESPILSAMLNAVFEAVLPKKQS